MVKKISTGLALVAGIAIVSVVISRIFGKKDEEKCDNDKCDSCDDCCCGR